MFCCKGCNDLEDTEPTTCDSFLGGSRCTSRCNNVGHFYVILTDTVKVKTEPKKEKEAKPQIKSQSRPRAKKTPKRQSIMKKEKNGVPAANSCPSEHIESQGAGLCSEEESQWGGSCSPPHKAFQRTLSPADVLHVHSYAKGDYAEGEPPPKEERTSEDSDNEIENDYRNVCKAVS